MPTWEDVRALALELPDAREEPGPEATFFSVRTKWFAVRSRYEENALVVRVDLDERQLLIASNPRAYLLPPRFERRSYLLVRLDEVPLDELRERLLDSWLLAAPKRLAASAELGCSG
jgi:hypothetical protein